VQKSASASGSIKRKSTFTGCVKPLRKNILAWIVSDLASSAMDPIDFYHRNRAGNRYQPPSVRPQKTWNRYNSAGIVRRDTHLLSSHEALEAIMATASNVLGTELHPCSLDPMTGFFRDGCCRSGADDLGLHLVCAEVTEDFLEFSRSCGNDLVTPVPEFHFPGLKPGDRWCLCVLRWREALDAGVAPNVVLEATHISTLEFVDLEDLQDHSVAP
jgi:uncharacterized protein (DUF2237 family)